MKSRPLLVFCHLRWNFVYQRPQHVLSRLARQRPVHVIEEPVFDATGPRWEHTQPHENLTVSIPHTPVQEFGFSPKQCDAISPLLRELTSSRGITECDAWTYTPLAFSLIESLRPKVVVYDCMDELSAFLNAPEELVRMEQSLMRRADLVFTGGPSLFASKRSRHSRVYCFSSSVDSEHFRRGVIEQTEPEVQKSLPHPRLGYFGVIDERIDLELIEKLADARPDCSIVMVGPIVKIDPAMAPRRANIHYFGKQEYADLPSFVKGWDVCLMPFAMNDATRYISPTKVLEYMAAGKPIVSTPIHDVVEPYGEIVYSGKTHEEFISACASALDSTREEKERRQKMADAVIANTSWDQTAASMEVLLETAAAPQSPKSEFIPSIPVLEYSK
jgi:UDP-galactopyranose mutase